MTEEKPVEELSEEETNDALDEAFGGDQLETKVSEKEQPHTFENILDHYEKQQTEQFKKMAEHFKNI